MGAIVSVHWLNLNCLWGNLVQTAEVSMDSQKLVPVIQCIPIVIPDKLALSLAPLETKSVLQGCNCEHPLAQFELPLGEQGAGCSRVHWQPKSCSNHPTHPHLDSCKLSMGHIPLETKSVLHGCNCECPLAKFESPPLAQFELPLEEHGAGCSKMHWQPKTCSSHPTHPHFDS